jgi:hypothetical protein
VGNAQGNAHRTVLGDRSPGIMGVLISLSLLEEAGRLLLQTSAMAVGLWQQADLPPIPQKVFARHAGLSFYRIDFGVELRKALEILSIR